MKYIHMLLSTVFLVFMIDAANNPLVIPTWLIHHMNDQNSNNGGAVPAQLAALEQLHDPNFGTYIQMPFQIDEEIPGGY